MSVGSVGHALGGAGIGYSSVHGCRVWTPFREGFLGVPGLFAEKEESSQGSYSAVSVNCYGIQEEVLVVDVADESVSVSEDFARLRVVRGLGHKFLPFTFLQMQFGIGRDLFFNIKSRVCEGSQFMRWGDGYVEANLAMRDGRSCGRRGVRIRGERDVEWLPLQVAWTDPRRFDFECGGVLDVFSFCEDAL